MVIQERINMNKNKKDNKNKIKYKNTNDFSKFEFSINPISPT